jgi:hypothetical protein
MPGGVGNELLFDACSLSQTGFIDAGVFVMPDLKGIGGVPVMCVQLPMEWF